MGKRTIINPDTGKIISDLQEGDKIIRNSTIEFLENTKVYSEGENFVSIYNKVNFAMSKKLTGLEVQLVHFLMPHILYRSYMLGFSNGRPLTRAGVIKYTGLSNRTIDRALSKLTSLNIIGKWKSGQVIKYYANPYIFKVGGRANKTLDSMFKEWRG